MSSRVWGASALTVALLATSCSSTKDWIRSEAFEPAGNDVLERDIQACKELRRKHIVGGVFDGLAIRTGGAVRADESFDQCMSGNGWVRDSHDPPVADRTPEARKGGQVAAPPDP